MVKCKIFETEHIDALWSLIEPVISFCHPSSALSYAYAMQDGVFEGLRDNMVQMTTALSKKMHLDHVRYVIDRISKGIGSPGYVAKNFMILHAILQREDTSVTVLDHDFRFSIRGLTARWTVWSLC